MADPGLLQRLTKERVSTLCTGLQILCYLAG